MPRKRIRLNSAEIITLPSLRHLSLCEEQKTLYDTVEGALAQIYTCLRLPSLILSEI